MKHYFFQGLFGYLLCLFAFEVSFATFIDILPGIPTSDSGVKVEYFEPLLNTTTDITEKDWSKQDLKWYDERLNFYFSDSTDWITFNVYALGDDLVTNGGVFWFDLFDTDKSLLLSDVAVVNFGNIENVIFSFQNKVISQVSIRFSDSDAGGFVEGLQYNTYVPEPSTMVLFGFGCLVMLKRALLNRMNPKIAKFAV